MDASACERNEHRTAESDNRTHPTAHSHAPLHPWNYVLATNELKAQRTV